MSSEKCNYYQVFVSHTDDRVQIWGEGFIPISQGLISFGHWIEVVIANLISVMEDAPGLDLNASAFVIELHPVRLDGTEQQKVDALVFENRVRDADLLLWETTIHCKEVSNG